MSSTIDLILTYVRVYYFRIMIVFLLVVFFIAGYYGYKSMYSTISSTNHFKDVANASPNGKEIVITMYHVDWCPHCKKAMPEWTAFVGEYNNKMVNGYKVICADLDCTDNKDSNIKSALEKDPVIDSFPTVRAVMPKDGGKQITIQFKSRIRKDNLEKFVLSISSAK